MMDAMASSGGPYPLLLGAEWVDEHTGGLNRYFADLLEALGADGGPEPAATLIGPANGSPAAVFPAATAHMPLRQRLTSFALQADKLSSAADVIDIHFALYGAAALMHRRARRSALVVHFHGPWADESAAQRGSAAVSDHAKRLIERAVYRRADRVVVLSEAFRDVVVDRYGVDRDRVTVARPGVNTDKFHVRPRSEARRDLDLDDSAFVVVSPRRLVPRMGLDVLIRAWAAIAPADQDRLVIIGEGNERQTLQTLADTLGIGDTVRFTGRVGDDELVTWYQAATTVAVPSRELEGFGLVVLEAAACGVPVIATDVGGLAEAAVGLSPDLIVPAGDETALAAALGRMRVESPVTAAECRAYAERHTWDLVAQEHREIYASVAVAQRLQVKRPKVALLTHSAQLAGAEIAIARLGTALEKRVDIIYLLGEDGPLCDELDRRGLPYEVMPIPSAIGSMRRGAMTLPGPAQAKAAWQLARHGSDIAERLRELDVDLVQTSSLKAHVYGAVAARKSGLPLAWYLHDRIAAGYLPTPAVTGLRQLARRTVIGVMANSHASLVTVPRTKGIRAVVGCPIEAPVDGVAGSSVTPGMFTFGVVGRLAPWKGQKIALRAFSKAFRGQSDVRCHVIGGALFGEQDYEQELRDLAVELGVHDQVDFRGHCQDMRAEYLQLDAAVHSSILPEPFGQVVVEAQAYGIPIIAAAAGGVLETVEHEVDGLLFAPGSAASLAEQMTRLRGDAALGSRLSAQGLTAATRFAPATVANSVEQFYQAVIERSHARW